jgi:radical SAM family uncharacterized protein/radical SAM-linked protein
LDVRRFDHPYSEFLDRVEKPTRYTGREHGARIKSWDSVAARICLAFPDIYDIGMSHLGYRILYQILNDEPRTLAERCYAPWIDLERELRERRLPLVSLESRRPLGDFDVVGFSLQFELCYSNVLTMLELGGIALRSADRDESAPLVLAGGPAATHAEPMAPFFDALVIGDGEQSAKGVALTWVEDQRRGLRRQERLEHLAEIEGIYVPSLYETEIDERSGLEVVVRARSASANLPVRRRILANLQEFPFPTTGPVGGPETVFDRLSVEVARGCTEGCRFCQAGMIYRPLRERSPQQVEHAVLAAVRTSGQDEVSLTALSTADVSYISPLIKSITRQTAPERVSLGVASLRAYGLSEDLLDELRKVRAAGLTFAPEAGTQRLRDVINKNISDEQLMETAQRVFSRGWDRMKLYFIAGLPTETDEDLAGIIDTGRRALEVGRRVSRKRVTVTVSVSIHVPKPHTPFQWCAMDRLAEVRRKQDLLRELGQKVRGLELRLHDATASVLEGILARGDRRLAHVIERAYRRGARFDSWDDQFRPDLWDEALAHCDIDRSLMLGTIPLDARLPWSHIHVGIDPEFLQRENRQAMKGSTSPPCGKPVGMHLHHTNVEDSLADPRKLVCYHCGIECDMTTMREERLAHLSWLGAIAPDARVKQTPVATPSDTEHELLPGAEGAENPEAHRPTQSGRHSQRFRLRFEKTGPASLLGHLDLIRELPRIFRRAGVRIAYTRGFHPKPDLAFAPALSLGVPSLDEYVDATLLDAPSGTQLLDALSEASSSGLRFLGATWLPERAPSLSKCIVEAEYAIIVPTSLVESVGGMPAIEQRIAEFMATESVVVIRHVDRDKKPINVRRFVTRLTLGQPNFEDSMCAARMSGDFRVLDLVVSCTPSGSAKALEVAQALFGQASRDCRAVRVALLDASGVALFHRFKSEGFDLSGLCEEVRSEPAEVA